MNKEIVNYLDKLIPNPKCELNYNKDYELLIAIVLSAQTTDKRVNKVTEKLFSKYPDLKSLSEADISDIEEIIREIGTYKRKSIYVKEIATKLVEDDYLVVPNDREYIESLPGVGRKTANVFLSNIYNEPAIAVDTHVFRVTNRIGIVNEKNVEKTEFALMDVIPKNRWSHSHHLFIFHGRRMCKARKPECDACPIKDDCDYYNNLQK